MVKISELSLADRQQMVNDITFIMRFNFKIDKESIEGFWDTVGIGIEVKKRV